MSFAVIAALIVIGCGDSGVQNKSSEVGEFVTMFVDGSNGKNGGNTRYTLSITISPPDGGTVSRNIDSSSYKAGTKVTMTATPNPGYEFSGWSGVSSSKDFTVTVTMDGNKALYAGFRRIGENLPEYNVYFNQNGANGIPPETIKRDSGSIISLPDQASMDRPGYSLTGWNTNSSGTGTHYDTYSSYTVTRNITLYAKWVPIYTVTFNDNNTMTGNAPMMMTADSGSSITLPDSGTMKKTNYNFRGWTVNSPDSGTTYATNTPYTVISNVTFYAKWIKTYTVTYNRNNATGDVPQSITVDSNTVITLPNQGSMALTDYYVFVGWSTNELGLDVTYRVGTPYTVRETVTLYAIWKRIFTDTFTDIRDGKIYGKVEIGGKWWMAENLNYDIVNGNGSWCYGNNGYNCYTYGRLYTWNVAMAACPSGWHLPTRDEWDNLVATAGGWETAGKKLKSTSGWYRGGNGTDDFGFSALPGGAHYGNLHSDGVIRYYFERAVSGGYWWTATEYNGTEYIGDPVYIRHIYYDYDRVFHDDYVDSKSHGFSVRCVED